MAKESKLREKAARMPDIRQAKWERVVSAYLESVKAQQSESAKSHRFFGLLKDLFGLQPGFIEDYVAGIEKYVKVKQKDRILRGRVDNLFGNLVIEFERDLSKTRREAEEQLQRYVACFWSQEAPTKRAPYLCLAADGIRFVVYSPTVEDYDKREIQPEEIQLEVMEEADLSAFKPAEVYFWLDRYFLRQEILAPTTEAIVKDFGLRSHAFRAAGQTLLSRWQGLKEKPEFSVVYESWTKYLLIVYGTSVADEELFIRHTYLSTLAKLMAWRRLTGERATPDDDQILSLLEGQFFKEQGIENFLEEDFFSWVAREDAKGAGIEAARQLLSLLQNYNLRELSEDVLKSLYQELVDPATRHDLGEYYTPDWLAHRMIRRLLEDNPQGTLLDPSCGSGTFLYLAVGEKRERLGDTRETLEHILDSVVGVDIHPLAVTVAKTNYILALGDLLKKRRGKVSIPIYLSDTIRLPERWADTPMADYEVEIDDQTIYLPQALLESPDLYDEAIEAAKEFAVQNVDRLPTGEQFTNYLRAQHPNLLEDDVPLQKLFVISQALRNLIESKRDTIWAFVLKNIYKPLFLRGNFDFVVGNPPWLSFRYTEPRYQEFLKEQITKTYGLLSGRGELITHMELATLFLLRAADLYLKDGATIAFVLPRSVFSADQHDDLRQGKFKGVSLRFEEVWDLEGVKPLFNVPSCVLFGQKEAGAKTAYPLPGQTLSGTLTRKNATLDEAEENLRECLERHLDAVYLQKVSAVFSGQLRRQRWPAVAKSTQIGLLGAKISHLVADCRPKSGRDFFDVIWAAKHSLNLTVESQQFYLSQIGGRSFWSVAKGVQAEEASSYKKHFRQGATIVPRALWFVEVKASPLGFNPSLPPLETAERAKRQAKEPYRGLVLKGNVESRFLYATLLSTDMLPFGYFDYRIVVLPIEPSGDGYRLITAQQAHKRGFFHLAKWLEKAQAEWEKRRGAKAARMDIYERLDRVHGLTAQNPQAKYRVLYPMSATYLCACVVENQPVEFDIGEQKVQANGLLVDYVTYHLETNTKDEARYLAATLNAPVIDRLIKPMQARGLWGPRHICKKVLELPIPQFDPSEEAHLKLAELGKVCTQKVTDWLEGGGPGKIRSIGKLRSMVREMLVEERSEIDEWVEPLLHAAER